jgi:hypothetical protein
LNGSLQSRVPYADYLKLPGLSISRLKEMKRSPQHCEYFMTHPRQSAPLTLGTAVHCKVLEPERFAGSYRIWERRTESGRVGPRSGKLWDAFEAEALAARCEVLTIDEADTAQAIADAVRSNTAAAPYLEAGDPEVTLQWDMQGRACRGRVDWLTFIRSQPVLVGLKSSRDCRPFYFGKQAAQLEYPQQWAWYFNGYHSITGKRPKMVEIVVESAPPYAVAVYVIPDDIILQGEEEYMKLLEQYAECERTGQWPGPVPQETELTLPTWYYGPVDDVSDLGLVAA